MGRSRLKDNQNLLLLLSSAGALDSGPNIILSNYFVDEGVSNGTEVGELSVARGSGTYTFALETNPSGKFSIDGNKLEVAGELDAEDTNSYELLISADNGVDEVIFKNVIIGVNNVLEAPVFLSTPEIVGTAQDGAQLVLSVPGVLQMPDGAGATFSYQWGLWDSGFTPFPGETNPLDFVLTGAQVGGMVVLQETATNGAGSTEAYSNQIGPIAPADEPEDSFLRFDRGGVTLKHTGML